MSSGAVVRAPPRAAVAKLDGKFFLSEGASAEPSASPTEVPFTHYMTTTSLSIGRSDPDAVRGPTPTAPAADGVDVGLGDSNKLSRQHAMIVYDAVERAYTIRCKGKNGLSVTTPDLARTVIMTPNTRPQPLASRSLVQMGDALFVFLLPSTRGGGGGAGGGGATTENGGTAMDVGGDGASGAESGAAAAPPREWIKAEHSALRSALMKLGYGRWDEVVSGANGRLGERAPAELIPVARRFVAQCHAHARPGVERKVLVDILREDAGEGSDGEKEVEEALAEADEKKDVGEARKYIRWARKLRLLKRLKDVVAHESVGRLREGKLRVFTPPPTAWWTSDDDADLILGTFKHGYGNVEAMRLDQEFGFAKRCSKALAIPGKKSGGGGGGASGSKNAGSGKKKKSASGDDPDDDDDDDEDDDEDDEAEGEGMGGAGAAATAAKRIEEAAAEVGGKDERRGRAGSDGDDEDDDADMDGDASADGAADAPGTVTVKKESSVNAVPPKKKTANSKFAGKGAKKEDVVLSKDGKPPKTPAAVAAAAAAAAGISVKITPSSLPRRNGKFVRKEEADMASMAGTTAYAAASPAAGALIDGVNKTEAAVEAFEAMKDAEGKVPFPSTEALMRRLKSIINSCAKEYDRDMRELKKKTLAAERAQRRKDDLAAKKQDKVMEKKRLAEERRKQKSQPFSKKDALEFERALVNFGVDYKADGRSVDWSWFVSKVPTFQSKYTDTLDSAFTDIMSEAHRNVDLAAAAEDDDSAEYDRVKAAEQSVMFCTLTLDRSERLLERVAFFRFLRNEVLPHPRLAQILRGYKKPRELPLWWRSQHDRALLSGVDRYGFNAWETVEYDAELGFASCKKNFMRKHASDTKQLKRGLFPKPGASTKRAKGLVAYFRVRVNDPVLANLTDAGNGGGVDGAGSRLRRRSAEEAGASCDGAEDGDEADEAQPPDRGRSDASPEPYNGDDDDGEDDEEEDVNNDEDDDDDAGHEQREAEEEERNRRDKHDPRPRKRRRTAPNVVSSDVDDDGRASGDASGDSARDQMYRDRDVARSGPVIGELVGVGEVLDLMGRDGEVKLPAYLGDGLWLFSLGSVRHMWHTESLMFPLEFKTVRLDYDAQRYYMCEVMGDDQPLFRTRQLEGVEIHDDNSITWKKSPILTQSTDIGEAWTSLVSDETVATVAQAGEDLSSRGIESFGLCNATILYHLQMSLDARGRVLSSYERREFRALDAEGETSSPRRTRDEDPVGVFDAMGHVLDGILGSSCSQPWTVPQREMEIDRNWVEQFGGKRKRRRSGSNCT